MNKKFNSKIICLFIALIVIICFSLYFNNYESFVGTAPGIGNNGIGMGPIAQKAKVNYNATGSVLPNTLPLTGTTSTESFWAPRARAVAYRNGY